MRGGEKRGEVRRKAEIGGDNSKTEEIYILFVVLLHSQPAAHSCDESSSFPTAVL